VHHGEAGSCLDVGICRGEAFLAVDGAAQNSGSWDITHGSDATVLGVPSGTIDPTAAAALLHAGGIVAIPTETVYGLAANALDDVAVARIFEAKKRPQFDPLIVHVDPSSVTEVALDVNASADALIDAFWPGPLTLVMRKQAHVSSLVTSGLDTVAVRAPSHPVAREILALAGVPLAAPSANSFGHLSPTTAEHVLADIGSVIDGVVDGGPCAFGVESTIVDVSGDALSVLRFGAIAVEDIERVVGPVEVRTSSTSNPRAPGQLESHYAPRTPLRIVDEFHASADAACLRFREPPSDDWLAAEVLSPDGDLVEAAARLFDVLHRLDASGATHIDVELVPESGVGRAINDRLRRAAVR
jgi:L-threonylcarbamoyladenylate synthase